MVKIGQVPERIAESDVRQLEESLGIGLPVAYRRFLLGHNGGVPNPDTIDVPGAPGSPTDIQVFFGIGRAIKTSNIAWNAEMFADRISGKMLPIASDSQGSLFCLSLEGADAGSVYFCDMEEGGRVHLVAPGFDAFLEAVREFE